ncbi:MAG: pyridoxine 5'-phosphate synthase [Desulfobacteraceae bacterium]|nr:pyridoxine 5'-phosphate synthase [Desulfobacteraceae bacterium]
MPNLTIQLDYVAGLRQSMQLSEPEPVAAAILAELGGADGIAIHISQEQRKSLERDARLLRETVKSRLILHMMPSLENIGIAVDIKPERVILICEEQEEKHEGNGFDLSIHSKVIFETIDTLQLKGISAGICIPADAEQVKMAHQLRANWIHIHAGNLRAATSAATQRQQWDKIIDTIKMAHKLRLEIAIGYGLNNHLIKLFKGVNEIGEFSMGRALIAKALLIGMENAVRETAGLIKNW